MCHAFARFEPNLQPKAVLLFLLANTSRIVSQTVEHKEKINLFERL